MSANPHIVTADTTFTWDHVPQRLGRGTIIDVPPDSLLLAAIGRDKLKPLFGTPPVTVAAEPAQGAQDAPGTAGTTAPRPPGRSRRSTPQAAPEAEGDG